MSHWDEVKDVKLDLSKIKASDDVEKLMSSIDEAYINELDTKLAEIRDRITKRERVAATILEITKALIKIGAKVI